jgi:hypothetical protein
LLATYLVKFSAHEDLAAHESPDEKRRGDQESSQGEPSHETGYLVVQNNGTLCDFRPGDASPNRTGAKAGELARVWVPEA